MTYNQGEIARLRITFTLTDGTLVDPTTVTLTVQDPANTQTIYSGTITRESLGKYHQDFTVALAGVYLYRWEGQGGVSVIEESTITAIATTLIPQPPTPTPTAPEFTYANLLAIDAAIASGVTTVSFADRQVTYQSLDDLLRIRNLIMGNLDTLGAVAPVRRQLRVYTSTGW